MKQTKIVLRNIYFSSQSKNNISLEVGEETKTFPGSAFGNSLFTRKSERDPSMPRNLEKVQNYPQPVKWATLF